MREMIFMLFYAENNAIISTDMIYDCRGKGEDNYGNT